MVNEDTRPPPPNPAPSSQSPSQNVPGDSGPTLVKTGEIMLIFALVIILLVVLFGVVHLTLRKKSMRFWGMGKKPPKKKPKKDLEAQSGSELHSVDKKIFEVAGTAVVLCELPQDAPPLQEMEADSTFAPMERTTSETSTLDVDVSPAEDPWPEGRELAVYWSARL